MKQKGQGTVEFTMVFPFLLFLCLAVIYMGAMFVDYIQYNNAARDAARDVSLKQTVNSRATLMKDINDNGATAWKNYATPITGLYSPVMTVNFVDDAGTIVTSETNAVDVQVRILLTRTVKFSKAFEQFIVLPESFPIVYRMKVEK